MTGPSEWVQQGRSRAVSPRGPLRGCHVLWEQHHGPAELTLHGLYLKEPVPCSFFRTGLTWHSLRTTLSNPKAIWAQRLSQHAAQDTTRGCGHLSAEAVPSSCRPGCTSGPRGFASASALLQPPSSPRGAGTCQPAGVRDELPNFHRAKTGQFPYRRGSKASWLHLVEMTK